MGLWWADRSEQSRQLVFELDYWMDLTKDLLNALVYWTVPKMVLTSVLPKELLLDSLKAYYLVD